MSFIWLILSVRFIEIPYCIANVLIMFCRLCLGAWTDHGERTGGFYACNRYEAAKQEGVVCNTVIYVVSSATRHCL